MRGNEQGVTEDATEELEIERGETEADYRALTVRVPYKLERTRHDGLFIEAACVGFLPDGEQIALTDLEIQVVEDTVIDRELDS